MNLLLKMVREHTGVPTASDFESPIGTPIVMDNTNGVPYTLLSGAVSPFRLPILATADLPAAGAAQNGLAILEDAGSGNVNLIIYGHAQRFRIDGGSAI